MLMVNRNRVILRTLHDILSLTAYSNASVEKYQLCECRGMRMHLLSLYMYSSNRSIRFNVLVTFVLIKERFSESVITWYSLGFKYFYN